MYVWSLVPRLIHSNSLLYERDQNSLFLFISIIDVKQNLKSGTLTRSHLSATISWCDSSIVCATLNIWIRNGTWIRRQCTVDICIGLQSTLTLVEYSECVSIIEPEPGERFSCYKINGGWMGQIFSKQVPQQGHSRYGNICPYLGDMDRSVHYYRNQVYKYLFKDGYNLKLKFCSSSIVSEFLFPPY